MVVKVIYSLCNNVTLMVSLFRSALIRVLSLPLRTALKSSLEMSLNDCGIALQFIACLLDATLTVYTTTFSAWFLNHFSKSSSFYFVIIIILRTARYRQIFNVKLCIAVLLFMIKTKWIPHTNLYWYNWNIHRRHWCIWFVHEYYFVSRKRFYFSAVSGEHEACTYSKARILNQNIKCLTICPSIYIVS